MSKHHPLMETITPLWEGDRLTVEDLPAIDLYMDQVTTLLEGKLGDPSRGRTGKPLTATMLGNYTKEGLLKKIKGKKYPREHLLMMALLYHLKGSLALGDIKALFSTAEETLSVDKNHYDSVAVETLFRDFERMQQVGAGQLTDLVREGADAFALGTEDSQQLLRTVLYLVNLSNLAAAAARELIAAGPQAVKQEDTRE